MTLPVAWMAEAAAEFREARSWYHSIRPQLAERFTQAVDAAIGLIADGPLHFSIVHKTVRRAGVRRFPYGIFFEAQADRVVVIACFHSRRNPARWQAR